MKTDLFISNYDAAIAHATAGIAVFPVNVYYDTAKDKWDKAPLIRDYPNNATTNLEKIKEYWTEHPDALPGIGLGQADLVLLDPDRHGGAEDGVAAWEALVAVHGLPPGPVVNTAGGGLHLYFKQPTGQKLGNGTGGLPEGIDVRGARGFVIAPGSIRPDGERWQPRDGSPLLTDSVPDVPVIPQWLVHLIREPLVPEQPYDPANPPPSGSREKAWAVAALAGMAKDLAAMGPNSGRNNMLTALAYRSGRLVINGWIDQAAVAEAFVQACRVNGLVAGDGLRTIESCIERGMGAGYRKPHPPLPEIPKLNAPTTGTNDAISQAVAELNQKYALVGIGGDFLIFETETRPLVQRTSSAMKLLFANQLLWFDGPHGPKSVNKYDVWLRHPDRRQYGQGVFRPSGILGPDEFNLYTGLAIKPVKGDWSLMRAHILENICGHNNLHFQWLMSWMAQLFQKPHLKQGSAVVLRGGKGVGKSILGDWIIRICDPHSRTITQSEQVVGRFNALLATSIFVLLEETFWAGDKKSEGVLKDLITGRTMNLEYKGVDPIQTENHLHLMLISNSDWVVPASADERRFFVLDVENTKQKNVTYFTAIERQMANGGAEAMLYDLLEFDFTKIDLRNPPHTQALDEQKLHSLTHEQAWLAGIIEAGEFVYAGYEHIKWEEDRELQIAKRNVFNSYKNFIRREKNGYAKIEAVLGKMLKKMIPSLTVTGGRTKNYLFPPLQIARREFGTYLGINLERL